MGYYNFKTQIDYIYFKDLMKKAELPFYSYNNLIVVITDEVAETLAEHYNNHSDKEKLKGKVKCYLKDRYAPRNKQEAAAMVLCCYFKNWT